MNRMQFFNRNKLIGFAIASIIVISGLSFFGTYVLADSPEPSESPKDHKSGCEFHHKKDHWTKPTEEEIKTKLQSAVEEGKLTQEEADAKLEAILSGEGKWGHKDKKDHWTKPTEEEIKTKLQSAVEEGKLTQEEADAKLEAILSGEGKWGHKDKRDHWKKDLIQNK